MRNVLLILLFVISSASHSQNKKINFYLQSTLSKAHPEEIISLFVKGDIKQIQERVVLLGGNYGVSAGGFIQVKLPAKNISLFSTMPCVSYIDYSLSKGVALCDTMIYHNNIDSVHKGYPPFLNNYSGKGVLLGFIDTGIDLVHPDLRDTLGKTRILSVWDQTQSDNGSSAFGYGVVWDSTSINNTLSTHQDWGGTSHGTHVTSIAAGNGLALGMYKGVAPESNIIMVASDFTSNNWLNTVVDGVKYIFEQADNYNMPCVINASVGSYLGSHDGTDAAAIIIDSLVRAKPGRVFVSSAGNAGHLKWHLQHNVNNDTTFTWFEYNVNSLLGYGAVFYEIWADTNDLKNVDFAIGANLSSGNFQLRGSTPFDNIANRIGLVTDTIKNNGNVLAIVETYGELQGGKYLLQIHLQEPDSNQYLYSLRTTGSGKLDVWSASWLGTSNIKNTGLPTVIQYPEIAYYQKPDSAQTITSSFQCHPNLITVGNMLNRKQYIDVDTVLRVKPGYPGELAASSSIGPNRNGVFKPDIAATGDRTIGANSADVITGALNSTPSNRAKVALGGMHRLNGGTSMASPVVAGVLALYLEKCPKSSLNELKNAIIQTTKKDTFTGLTPNNRFGYGKLDAFQALKSSNFNVTLGGNLIVCDKDTIQISPGNYSTYNWFNGDTTSTIYVDSTELVFVEVTNNYGCVGISDSVYVTWSPLPAKPQINYSNDTLYTNLNNVKWHYNNMVIVGETSNLYYPLSSGNYFVSYTDSNGCTNFSDTINVIIPSVNEINNSNLLNIYPNPATNNLTIEINNEKGVLKIIDSIGKVIYSKTVNQNKNIVVNTRQFEQGLYIVNYTTEHLIINKKVLFTR